MPRRLPDFRPRPARALAALLWAALGAGADARAQDLAPDALFRQVAGSVYIVLAADNADLKAMMGNPVVPPDQAPGAAPPTARERALREVGRGKRPPLSLGSAVALTPEIAVTNCHVVANHQFVAIVEGNRGVPAKVVQYQPNDVCLLHVAGLALKPVAAVRMSADVRVGERAYAIGNPRGLERSLSEGLVSGMRVRDKVKIVQTTALISPGSSGGGLFDAAGRLIGITTFKSQFDPQLNFAVAPEEFWPLPETVLAGGVAPVPAAPSPVPSAPPSGPRPVELQPDALTRCGPIELRGINFVTSTVKCIEREERKFSGEAVEVSQIAGGFASGTLEVFHARIIGERNWSPLSATALRQGVADWAKAYSPTNISPFQPNPFPHYSLNIAVKGRDFACARGTAYRAAGKKVTVWLTYCEPGRHVLSAANVAAVFRAVKFD
ncbi:MAG: trypsin-like peptidase domain-containing protein [Alphaproteobacteria bacterium]|nr:trypsin-like peptidase domain-containing protein [Alphaproteobacteria bacterium]